jgi:N-acetylglucosaminyldiphosphoundecaprenol N-acetyl-beta-D-mannosaminyltransferase
VSFASPAISPSNTPPIAPIERQRANVLGVGVHALNLARAAEIVETSVSDRRKGYICVTGVHGIMEAHRDAGFHQILNRALLVIPDGMPTVWIGRAQKHTQMRRVFGPELMLEVCRRSVRNGMTHFLYGGKPGIAQQLQQNLSSWFPGIQVMGAFTPPFRVLSPDELAELRKTIATMAPDIIWVGLSTPKQERFMAENLEDLDCQLMIGVGAAFDIHTGKVKDAPRWVKNAGLQWLHRLGQEPSRLWKRYLVNNSTFLFRLALQITGLKRYELSTTPTNPPAPR